MTSNYRVGNIAKTLTITDPITDFHLAAPHALRTRDALRQDQPRRHRRKKVL
jgi:hypothetical protein